jgi:hypothetical protein
MGGHPLLGQSHERSYTWGSVRSSIASRKFGPSQLLCPVEDGLVPVQTWHLRENSGSRGGGWSPTASIPRFWNQGYDSDPRLGVRSTSRHEAVGEEGPTTGIGMALTGYPILEPLHLLHRHQSTTSATGYLSRSFGVYVRPHVGIKAPSGIHIRPAVRRDTPLCFGSSPSPMRQVARSQIATVRPYLGNA